MERDLEATNSSAAAAASPSWFSGLVPVLSVKNPSAGDGAAGSLRPSLQIIFFMGDEHVPEYVDKKALAERLSKAMGGAEMVVIGWGNHSLSNRVEEAVQVIINFVRREGPKGWDDPWN